MALAVSDKLCLIVESNSRDVAVIGGDVNEELRQDVVAIIEPRRIVARGICAGAILARGVVVKTPDIGWLEVCIYAVSQTMTSIAKMVATNG